MTIYQQAIKAKLNIDSHQSDLYIEDSKKAWKILSEHPCPNQISKFHSEKDNKPWIEVAFAYDPFWNKNK